MPDRGPVADFELGQVRHAFPAWDITHEGQERFVARDGYGREVIAPSPRVLGVLLGGKAFEPLTGRNPHLPDGTP
jgi:hypothetical protein